MPAGIIAWGAASALGVGRCAFDVGNAGARPREAWSTRPPGKPFGRVTACDAPRAERPRVLLELGLAQLLEQLNLGLPDWRERRLGVVLGTSSGGFAALEVALVGPPALSAEHFRSSAYFAPLTGMTALLGCTPERFVSLYAACASSALAIGLGTRWLELGAVDLVIAGGYDAESDWVCAGFDALKATSSARPRPFRAERDGMALGEGVGVVALVREARTAFGFVSGFAASTDAVHITAPDRHGAGLARAAESALAEAGASPRDVAFVSAHGTGTSFNDAAEAAALSHVFGAAPQDLVLHAFKSVIGHTLGAAGALETLAALAALENGVAPASASAGSAMPQLPARLLDVNEASGGEHCLKLATAFGGANAALVLSRRPSAAVTRSSRAVYLVALGTPCVSLDLARLDGLLQSAPERLPRSDVLSELAVAASAEALRAAHAAGIQLDRLRTGVVVGSVGASLQANAEFAARIIERGLAHAEPRRFPSTSPNACAGHTAIAFGLGAVSHAVGASAAAAAEALEVAHAWIAAGDAEAMLVVAAEHSGSVAGQALAASGVAPPPEGAFALLLSHDPRGPELSPGLLAEAWRSCRDPENNGFRGLEAWARAASLPGRDGFGSVRPPE